SPGILGSVCSGRFSWTVATWRLTRGQRRWKSFLAPFGLVFGGRVGDPRARHSNRAGGFARLGKSQAVIVGGIASKPRLPRAKHASMRSAPTTPISSRRSGIAPVADAEAAALGRDQQLARGPLYCLTYLVSRLGPTSAPTGRQSIGSTFT